MRCIINAVAGLLPIAGSPIAAANGLWGEREQAAINQLVLDWAAVADIQMDHLVDALNSLQKEPTRASLALLLGELFGNNYADALMSGARNGLHVMLNPVTIEELGPYVAEGLVVLKPTHNIASMGCGNRVGDCIEELKRANGFGNSFVLSVVRDSSNDVTVSLR